MLVNAAVSRHAGTCIQVLQAFARKSVLAPLVIVHCGNNGALGPGFVDQVMQIAGPHRNVMFVSLKVPRSWQDPDNAELAHDVARYQNARIYDWHNIGRPLEARRTSTSTPTAITSHQPVGCTTRSIVLKALQDLALARRASSAQVSAAPTGRPGRGRRLPIGSRRTRRRPAGGDDDRASRSACAASCAGVDVEVGGHGARSTRSRQPQPTAGLPAMRATKSWCRGSAHRRRRRASSGATRAGRPRAEHHGRCSPAAEIRRDDLRLVDVARRVANLGERVVGAVGVARGASVREPCGEERGLGATGCTLHARAVEHLHPDLRVRDLRQRLRVGRRREALQPVEDRLRPASTTTWAS